MGQVSQFYIDIVSLLAPSGAQGRLSSVAIARFSLEQVASLSPELHGKWITIK